LGIWWSKHLVIVGVHLNVERASILSKAISWFSSHIILRWLD
jgi:hypothetical protein